MPIKSLVINRDEKIAIIAGIILLILGPVYLYVFDKITTNDDLIKLIIAASVFNLLVYLFFRILKAISEVSSK